MKLSGNVVDRPSNRWKVAPDSGGTLTTDLSKINAKGL